MYLAQQAERPLIQFTLEPLLEDFGVPLAVMGILVVFVALVLVVAFITVLPRVLATSPAGEQETAPAMSRIGEDELSEETLVVITAAVAAVMGKPHRIVRIGGLDLGWSLEGRTQHHQSHRIQNRDRR